MGPTRRRTGRRVLTTVALVVMALVAAACGGGDDEGNDAAVSSAAASAAGSPTTEAAERWDPNGVLRRPVDLAAQGALSFDPATINLGQYQFTYPVLASLLKLRPDYKYEPDLALSGVIVDPQTIDVELRPNLRFSDGAVLDAQAAVNSIQRTKDRKAPGLRTAELALVNGLTVKSATGFTIKLSQPVAGLFYSLLADAETAPVSPATIAAPGDHGRDVIAAGPFKLQSYEPAAKVVMVKNDRYWDAANVRLAVIEYLHATAGSATVNALRAGQADYAQLQFTDRGSFGQGYTVQSEMIPAPYQVNMCIRGDNPLGNLKVRQALNYATDRDDINTKLYDGKSRPAWGLFPEGHKLSDASLKDVYRYDPVKAKQLLAEAGYPNGFTMNAITQTSGEAVTIHEILQAQWAKVGVQTNIIKSVNTGADWNQANGSKGLINVVPLIRVGVGTLTRNLMSDAASNVCKTPVPELDALARQVMTLDQSAAAAVPLWGDIQKNIVKDFVWGVMTVFVLQTFAHNDRLGGMAFQLDAINQRQPDVTKVFVKA